MSRYLKCIKVNKQGFTLIETIAVIAIIGILSAIMVPSMTGYLNTTKEYKKKMNAKAFYTAAQAAVTSLEASGIILDKKSFTSPSNLEGVEKDVLFSRIRKLIGAPNYEGFDEIIVNIKDGAVTSVDVVEKGSTEKVTYPPRTAQDEDSENNNSDNDSNDNTDSDSENNGNNSNGNNGNGNNGNNGNGNSNNGNHGNGNNGNGNGNNGNHGNGNNGNGNGNNGNNGNHGNGNNGNDNGNNGNNKKLIVLHPIKDL